MTRSDLDRVDLGSLIEELGPLNNRWRDGSAPDKVLALWDMGDTLIAASPNASDSLLWKVQERSYITRNLLRYALIIRRAWPERKSLLGLVEGLRSYAVFREALPFLKGDRAGIDDATYGTVLALIRDPDVKQAVAQLRHLKSARIGRKHKKGAAVANIRESAAAFETGLRRLEADLQDGAAPEIQEGSALLLRMSQVSMALATGGAVNGKPPIGEVPEELRGLVDPLIDVLNGGRQAMNAFRRTVGADRLMQAADLLNSMRSRRTLVEWRLRRGAALTLNREPRKESSL